VDLLSTKKGGGKREKLPPVSKVHQIVSIVQDRSGRYPVQRGKFTRKREGGWGS